MIVFKIYVPSPIDTVRTAQIDVILSIHCSVWPWWEFLFRSDSHDVYLFLIDVTFLKCTQRGFKCPILAVHSVEAISYGLSYNLIQLDHSPSSYRGFCACVVCRVKSNMSFRWLMRSVYLPAMCLQCDGGRMCLRRDGDIFWLPASFRTGLWEDGSCKRLKVGSTGRQCETSL